MSSYGLPGWGGRAPVAWLGRPPNRAEKLSGRRPVVAVLDTGVGDHRWFRTSGVVLRNPELNGVPMGLQDPADDPELTGVITDPLEGPLDSDSGHGTFIAGLIHQLCPDANILSIRVMPSDGAVPEHVLLDALNLLALRQQLAQQPGGDPADLVDVVSLSLGYYHEQPEDAAADPLLLQPLNALAESGAIVVAAAGNDATVRPLFPAAFAPDPQGIVTKADASRVPITAVGALNPDLTIALFSNAGPWVKVYRPGAALVSTFPETFNASAQPAYRLHAFDGWRETIDPDDFSGGFGTWSGTSFSAPVLAGEIAQQLLDGEHGPFDAVDPTSMVERGWACVTAHTHLERPS
jgi:subtilisin family serine protease